MIDYEYDFRRRPKLDALFSRFGADFWPPKGGTANDRVVPWTIQRTPLTLT